MRRLREKKQIRLFTALAVALAVFFPLAATVVALQSGAEMSLKGIVTLHTQNYMFLLDLAAISLPFLLFFTNRYFSRKTAHLSQQVETELEKSEKIFVFAQQLTQGNIEAELPLDTEKDQLGHALIDLRNSLRKTKQEEEERRKEDQQRHWTNEGLARFGEILRQNNDNIEELSFNIISNLVKYLEVNQGAFYVLNEDQEEFKYFELTACIAYERKKYKHRTFEWKEGLVGRCALEKQMIYITDVPNQYISITSGLGTANPHCLVLIPLVVNDQVHGVMELAAFSELEKYRLNFLEKLSESIASTLATVKINVKTSQLLRESQIQAEKLAQQEEEMRQNMDELRATQAEAAKQSEEFISFTNSVNHTLIRAEYSTEGILLYANTKFLKKLGYSSNDEVEGKHISMFINEKDRDWFDKIWSNLAKGGRHFENYMKHVTKDGTDLWTMATYTCVRNPDGSVRKILFLAIDTTEEKQRSLDYEGQIQALNRTSSKIEFTNAGAFIDCNDRFLATTGYSKVEMRDKTVFHFVRAEELRSFKQTWDNVVNGIPFEGQFRMKTQMGEERWFQATFSSVHDMYGEIAKVVFIGNDITEQKHMELKTQKQAEILRAQEEKLRQSQVELSRKLDEARAEMKEQYKEIETVKILHEKTLEGMLDAIVRINKNEKIEFFNKAAENLWGLSREDVLGKSIKVLLPTKYEGKEDNYMGNFFQYGAKHALGTRTEVFIIDHTGEHISVLLTLSEAQIENAYTLTAFIQTIEVELF